MRILRQFTFATIIVAAFLLVQHQMRPASAASTTEIAGSTGATLTAGLWQETDPRITYSGTWLNWASSGPNGGATRYTNQQGAMASFTFDGTGFTLYRLKANTRGNMEVCIDGACQTVNNYSATLLWNQPISFGGLAAGVHSAAIRNASSAYLDVDAVQVLGDTQAPTPVPPTATPTNPPVSGSSTLTAGLHQETDPRIAYSGTWLNWASSGPNGGATRYTNQQGAMASFTFDGTGFTLYRLKANTRGNMEVCIDGACQTVNNYSATLLWNQPISFGGLAAGVHSAAIRNASSAYLDVDAVQVLDASNPGSQTIDVPVLAAPGQNASFTATQQPILFGWSAAAGAQYYRLQVSTTTTFSSADLVVNNGGVQTNTNVNTGVIFAAGTYYWRVRGGASDGKGGYLTGEWSEVRTFSVTAGGAGTSTRLYTEQRPYSPDSVWNTPIGANPAIEPNSSTMIGRLGNTRTGGRIYSDTTQYTYPVYFADASTPRYDVPCRMYKCTVVNPDGSVVRVTTMTNVPIPTGAQVSSGTDAQMIVVDTTTGMEYGFYHGRWTSGGYETDGGYQYNVNWNGTPVPFGSRGAGVTYYAGLIRPWEIRAGEINHAIAFAYDIPRGTRCVYPATQTDGTSGDTYALPEGARLQLNPALTDADFNAWGLSATGKVVARALQRYGMILIDTGGSLKIMAENLSINPLTTESWDSLGYTKNVIANIPYSQFRVLDLPDAYWNSTYSPNYGRCIR